MASLHRGEWPKGVESPSEDPFIYTDFEHTGKGSLELTIDLAKAPRFACRYMNRQLFKMMERVARVRNRNFIRNNVLWFYDEEYNHHGWKAFRRFELRTSIGKFTGKGEGERPMGELLVNVQGHRYVSPESVLDYHGEPSDINWIVYNGLCLRYGDIPARIDIDNEKVLPVLNREIAEHKNISMPFRYEENKMKSYYEQLERLRMILSEHEEFNREFPLTTGEWHRPKRQKIHRLKKASRQLVFKGGRTAIEPKTGIYKHGGYRSPRKHSAIFFIMSEEDAKEGGNGQALKKALIEGGKGFRSLRQYTNTPIKFFGEDVVFTDIHNPLPEIRERLDNLDKLDDNLQMMALYVSPIPKEKQGPRHKRPYYRLKEWLLRRGISMQTIYRGRIREKSFKYHMRNIAPAVLAKLGGVPWKLAAPEQDELIVGIGAFKPQDKDQQYVGSAFCFDNSGTFKGFQCFEKRRTYMLAGSIRQAVHRYVKEHGKPERLVIHYYKQMSYRERKPIEDTLRDLGLGEVPVVIVTLNKTPSFDTVLFDAAWEEKMPYSGTYLRLDHHRLLLCNNTRYPGSKYPPKDFHFPVKVQVESPNIRGFMFKEDEVERIVRQIYQFSRIYWKSADQQNLPVTIKYPEMVAKMLPYFEQKSLPVYARESLWFL
jgi:hypothetical protein